MQTSALLLIASLGSITVLLMLYSYIFMYDRRAFLLLWFAGWTVIALNYLLEAFFLNLLRQNQMVFSISLGSYFCANLLLTWGTLLFLKVKVKTPCFIGIGSAWLIIFAVLLMQNLSALFLIQFTYISVFALSVLTAIIMIGLSGKFGSLIIVPGLLNIAWVVNNVIFSFILKMPHMEPYIGSQIILILNAAGLILFYFREQKNEVRKGLDHITYLTNHDGLTGLYNKAYFDNILHEIGNKKENLPVSLIVGDMNGLKFINDVFGHHEGDNRLKIIAQIIRQSCRENDIIARWGGDEFAVILPNTDIETAESISDKIIGACGNLQGMELFLGLSLGVAAKTDEKSSLADVLKEAEEQMYQAKLIENRKGRERIAETLKNVFRSDNIEVKEHAERLQMLVKEFAKALGFSEEDRDTLLAAVMIYYISKAGVLKDSELNMSRHDDPRLLRRYVEIGCRLAQASGESAYLADIISCHHEWWNGKGLPSFRIDSVRSLKYVISPPYSASIYSSVSTSSY
jgi:diguanylate cyclase (GGDEF)-like protein